MRGVVVPLGNAHFVAYLTESGALRAVMHKGARQEDALLSGTPALLTFSWLKEGDRREGSIHWTPLTPLSAEGVVATDEAQLRLRVGWEDTHTLRIAWHLTTSHPQVHTLAWELAPEGEGVWGNGTLQRGQWRLRVALGGSEGVWWGTPLLRLKQRKEAEPMARFEWRRRVRNTGSGTLRLHFSHALEAPPQREVYASSFLTEGVASRLSLLPLPRSVATLLQSAQQSIVAHAGARGLVYAPLEGREDVLASAHAASLLWRNRHYTLARLFAQGSLSRLAQERPLSDEGLLAVAHVGYALSLIRNTSLLGEFVDRMGWLAQEETAAQTSTAGGVRLGAYAAAVRALTLAAEATAHRQASRVAQHAHAAELRARAVLLQEHDTLPRNPLFLDVVLAGGFPFAHPQVRGALLRFTRHCDACKAAAALALMGDCAAARARLLSTTLLPEARDGELPSFSLHTARWLLEGGLRAWWQHSEDTSSLSASCTPSLAVAFWPPMSAN